MSLASLLKQGMATMLPNMENMADQIADGFEAAKKNLNLGPDEEVCMVVFGRKDEKGNNKTMVKQVIVSPHPEYAEMQCQETIRDDNGNPVVFPLQQMLTQFMSGNA